MQDETETPGTAEMLDLRGLKCPLPVLRTRRALERLAPGRLLVVRCTDPLAGLDIPNLVRETGDSLLEAVREGTGSRFTIRRHRSGGPGGNEPPGSNGDSPRCSAVDNSEASSL